jgi:hypothetical protein
MGLAGFLGVFSRVKRMASSRVGMMCGFLVVSAIVMLGRFAVMMGSVGMMFCGLPMVLGSFFRHEYDFLPRLNRTKGKERAAIMAALPASVRIAKPCD